MHKTSLAKKIVISLFLFVFSLIPAFASEKPASEGIRQVPEIFVQLGQDICGNVYMGKSVLPASTKGGDNVKSQVKYVRRARLW
ncbi:MAG: hypothetical protein HY026_08565 [Deltaproteobacteria bacterium]|nr:hypothetical protein [Deltaproteobacteria bacterium]